MGEVIFDVNDILEILPHRHPFLLVDRVIEFVENVRITAIKNVTYNESFFPGHFPGRPVMPGVLILEAMAQTGGILAHRSTDGPPPGTKLFLAGADNVKWRRPVQPGDTLQIEMRHIKTRRPLWIMEAKATVDGNVVAIGTITAAEVPADPVK